MRIKNFPPKADQPRTEKFKIPARAGGKNSGFTLLETLVALSVLTFAMVGPVTLAVYSIRSISFSQNQITAFYLAQEAMEYIRNRRDNNALQNRSNWLEGLVHCRNADGCYVDPTHPESDPESIVSCPPAGCPKLRYNSTIGLYSYNASAPETIFSRKVKLTQISSYEEKVEIILSWQTKGISKSFTLEENFLDWP